MPYALYLDPAKKYTAPELPVETADVTYWRLTDCSAEAFDVKTLPQQARDVSCLIAEIDAQNMSQFGMIAKYVHRVCIQYHNNTTIDLQSVAQSHIVDMTYHWRKSDNVETVKPLLQKWIAAGVHQISLYDLSDYHEWLTLAEFLQQNGYVFFDRFHAARDGFASPYQKHVAQYGDVYALGGWSRITENAGVTRVKSPTRKTWQVLSADDARWERLVLGMAHRDGMYARDVAAMCGEENIAICCQMGYATRTADGRLVPTDAGLWDNLGLVSYLLAE